MERPSASSNTNTFTDDTASTASSVGGSAISGISIRRSASSVSLFATVGLADGIMGNLFTLFKEEAQKVIGNFAYDSSGDLNIIFDGESRKKKNQHGSSTNNNELNLLERRSLIVDGSESTTPSSPRAPSTIPGSQYTNNPTQPETVQTPSAAPATEQDLISEISISTQLTTDSGSNVVSPLDSNNFLEILLQSFASVSKHCIDSAVEAVCGWRTTLDLSYQPHRVKPRGDEASLKKSVLQKREQLQIHQISERLQLAADYIFCSQILLFLSSAHQTELSPSVAAKVEEAAFAYFSSSERFVPTNDPALIESRKKVLELFAEIVGHLSAKRFILVERYIKSIETKFASSSGKSESAVLVRALKHVRLQIAKADALALSTQFLKKMLELFKRSKKTDLKVAFFETITTMLTPLAAFEYKGGIDYRDWFSVLKDFHLYALKQQKKSKYVLFSNQLISTILCASPREYFLDNFWGQMEILFKLFKDKSTKLISLDCFMHIIGFYLKIVVEDDKIASSSPNSSNYHYINYRNDSKDWNERLQRVSTVLCLNGKKSMPQPALNLVYNAIVDLIVMISSKKFEFAMDNFVVEMLNADILSENMLVGLRALMAVANQLDISKLTSMLEDSSKPHVDSYPDWVVKLLENSPHLHRSTGSMDDEDFSKNSIRITSPFVAKRPSLERLSFGSTISFRVSPINSLHNTSAQLLISGDLASTGSVMLQNFYTNDLISTFKQKYESKISHSFSKVLRSCDSKYGQLLQTIRAVPLSESAQKLQAMGFVVFATALRGITRLLPCDYTPQELVDLLCRCIIHQDEDIRSAAWEVILHIVDFQPTLRAVLVHSFSDLIITINDWKTHLQRTIAAKLIEIIQRWIEQLDSSKFKAISEELSAPTIYGSLKEEQTTMLEPARVEGVALVMFCSVRPKIRCLAFEICKLVRSLSGMLGPDQVQSTSSQSIAFVAEILQETSASILERAWAYNTKHVDVIPILENPPASLLELAQKDDQLSQYKWADCLREIAKLCSDYCPSSVLQALPKIFARQLQLQTRLDTTLPDNNFSTIMNMWRNYINFGCSASVLKEDSQTPTNKRTKSRDSFTRTISSSQDLFDTVISFINPSFDETVSTTAVNALGGVHHEVLEILLRQLNVLEQEIAEKGARGKKKRDFIRAQLARIYSILSSSLGQGDIFTKSTIVRTQFIEFVKAQIAYLSLPQNLFDFNLQRLRFDVFVIIENLSYLFATYFPRSSAQMNEDIDHSTRWDKTDVLKFMGYIISWTGYHLSSAAWETEESFFRESILEKIKDQAAETEELRNLIKSRAQSISRQARLAFAALMLADTNIEATERGDGAENIFSIWSKQNLSSTNSERWSRSQASSALSMTDSLGNVQQQPTPTSAQSPGKFRSSSLSFFSKNITASRIKEPFQLHLGSLGITCLDWITLVLRSPNDEHRTVGETGTKNLLKANPQLINIFVEQCYHHDPMVARGFFSAVVGAFESTTIKAAGSESGLDACDVAMMLGLFLYMALDNNEVVRNQSHKFLRLISERFFTGGPAKTNFPYMISSTLPYMYLEHTHYSISEKLATSHPEFAVELIEHVKRRLEYMGEEKQMYMLKSLTPWVASFTLVPFDYAASINNSLVQQSLRLQQNGEQANTDRVWITGRSERILLCLFEITRRYGDKFPQQAMQLWATLAEEPENINVVVDYLIHRGTRFTRADSDFLFDVAKKIVLYLSLKSPQYTVDLLAKIIGDKSQHGSAAVELSNKQLRSIKKKTVKLTIALKNNNGADLIPPDEMYYMDRADVAMILLAELCYKHEDELLGHLPVLLQYLFLRMDHKVHFIHQHTRTMLCNLIHTFVVRKLPHNMAAKSVSVEQVERLETAMNLIDQIKYKGVFESLWDRDKVDSYTTMPLSEDHAVALGLDAQFSKNTQQLASVVNQVMSIFSEVGQHQHFDIKERWSGEALLWATKSTSTHNVLRSYQIFRTLKPAITTQHIYEMLLSLHHYLKDVSVPSKLAIIIEIITTIRVLINAMEPQKIILFPQLFWACVALLNTDSVHVFARSLQLLSELIDKLDVANPTVQTVLMASFPPELENIFDGLQPLVLRGLTDPRTEAISIELLTKFTLFPCENIVDPSASRLLMNLMGLLPWLCIHVGESNEKHRCYLAAKNLASAFENTKGKKISQVLLRYSNAQYGTQDKFLQDLRKPLSELFPGQEPDILCLLEHLLENGPDKYHKSVLAVFYSFLMHVNVNSAPLYQREGLIHAVIRLINGPLWQEATRVLDIAVKKAGLRDKTAINNESLRIPQNSNMKSTFTEKPSQGSATCLHALEKVLCTYNFGNSGAEASPSPKAADSAINGGSNNNEQGAAQPTRNTSSVISLDSIDDDDDTSDFEEDDDDEDDTSEDEDSDLSEEASQRRSSSSFRVIASANAGPSGSTFNVIASVIAAAKANSTPTASSSSSASVYGHQMTSAVATPAPSHGSTYANRPNKNYTRTPTPLYDRVSLTPANFEEILGEDDDDEYSSENVVHISDDDEDEEDEEGTAAQIEQELNDQIKQLNTSNGSSSSYKQRMRTDEEDGANLDYY